MRRSIFSGYRRRLFSDSLPLVKKVQCRDCGFEMEVSGTTMNYSCPKCGSVNRFNLVPVGKVVQTNVPEPEKVEKSFSGRRSLFGEDTFQKEFSTTSNEFEKNLKLYSGKEVNILGTQRLFGMPAEELEERGFGKIEGNSLKLSDSAYLQSKVFSKLIVSVTKVLDLDEPTMCKRPVEDTIDLLESKGTLSPKGIMIIKKGHRLPMLSSREFSDHGLDLETWVKDSRIVSDLKVEYGNSGMGMSEFMGILQNRYPDAPEGIIDYLVNNGVVRISGNQVDFTN